jgi:hypothetical protein
MKDEKYRITQKPDFDRGHNAPEKGNASLTARSREQPSYVRMRPQPLRGRYPYDDRDEPKQRESWMPSH